MASKRTSSMVDSALWILAFAGPTLVGGFCIIDSKFDPFYVLPAVILWVFFGCLGAILFSNDGLGKPFDSQTQAATVFGGPLTFFIILCEVVEARLRQPTRY